MEIINLTPHEITLISQESTLVLPASGLVARVRMEREVVDTINGFPVNRVIVGEVYDLPEAKAGTVYIVSRATAEAVPTREDLLTVDQTVRDEEGKIVGATALARI